MSTGAIITMIVVQVTVTIVTAYFFMRVIQTPSKEKASGEAVEDD